MRDQLSWDELMEATGIDPSPASGLKGRSCTATFNLPAGGVIVLSNGEKVTLTDDAAFRPSCTPQIAPAIIANGGGPGVSVDETTAVDLQGSDFRDPFYASTFPQSYALAATTVISYTLVIMLFITPRSFLDGGVVVLGRKGFTNGGNGTNIGGRPWLQKVAALTVAISLTIATTNTFKVAAEQYSNMIENAGQLQDQVLDGTELKVIRIISNSFLWLAQAQTLIRLFPRQREKIIIKWTAFALITLDVIFQSLNSFQYTSQGQTQNRPQNFTEAVPALSYLFELALGVLYAAWVIYYSLMKKRYAFYHQKMKNVGLVAGLSLISILVPIVFFILDVSKPEFTGWGDYVRWVGAAAASVIVWEWVERIEALEREEKKDGILGREVFDGDEMMEITPSDFSWPRKRTNRKDGDDPENGRAGQDGGVASARGNVWPGIGAIASRYRSRSKPDNVGRNGEPRITESSNNDRIRFLQPPPWPARPTPAATPVSRTDTASAASTVYAIRYRPLTETSRATPPPVQEHDSISRSNSIASRRPSEGGGEGNAAAPADQNGRAADPQNTNSGSRWRALAQGISLPRVIRTGSPEAFAPVKDDVRRRDYDENNRWDIRARFEEFAMSQAERLRERMRPTPDTDSLPVMVIPAPARRGAALAQLREQEELESQRSSDQIHRTNTNTSRTLAPEDSNLSTTRVYRSNTAGSSVSQPRIGPTIATQAAFGSRARPGVTIIPAPPRSGVASPAQKSPSPPDDIASVPPRS